MTLQEIYSVSLKKSVNNLWRIQLKMTRAQMLKVWSSPNNSLNDCGDGFVSMKWQVA